MNISWWLSRLGRAGAACVLALGACGEAKDEAAERAEKGPELQLVYSVDRVSIRRLAKTPPAAVLEVEGTAASAGWSGISLEPTVIENDTLTYRLMGVPPDGMAAQVLTAVKAERLMDPLPDGVAKIRVTALQNELIEPVPPEE